MSSVEKKVAAVLVVVLIAMIGVYFAVGAKEVPEKPLGPPPGAFETMAQQPGHSPGGGETRVMGPEDAAVKIIGFVPTVKGCHDATVAALEEVYNDHPDDIHLTLVDYFGPEASDYKAKLGVSCATVTINGEKTFDLKGRKVTFEKAEGMSYRPDDLKVVVEAELKALKG